MIRDRILVEDDQGVQQEFGVEGMFEMDERNYVLLTNEEDTILMQIVGEGEHQELVGIDDPEEAQSLLDAYQIAVDAAPAEGENDFA
ncbi:DUF1292 domain-containing protein [Tumebacillus algifaecis]|uniref:DUF1292 domain-containing protein n=1 Tax=Tumebacillus algifaecis TaxID=1214604 RepID=A0A223CYC5_9BACL|nr:DUF1292 domain-containing protein [Tumebacillus algifaecis]ASS74338.1 DUF1292 domain-containing protein [Tumebacillus algifaecis]